VLRPYNIKVSLDPREAVLGERAMSECDRSQCDSGVALSRPAYIFDENNAAAITARRLVVLPWSQDNCILSILSLKLSYELGMIAASSW
jgi:hypothetical protein